MLRQMRKHAKYFYVLFFVVILSFIFWGVGGVDQSGTAQVVAEIGKYKISAEDYWKTYDRAFRFYREIYKDKFDEDMAKKLNLKENVLNSMINERVLLMAAKEAGIGVSDEELQEAIEHEPAFRDNGVFSKEMYLNRLRLNRITPEEFEKSQRQELTLNKMKNLIEVSADLTAADLQSVKTSGDEKAQKMIGQAILSDTKNKALKSYVDGLKKNIKITINEKLLS
jgi:parvulin-like peptidyl-prolyl isomerase